MDNYDTPDYIAQKMAKLAYGRCCEPAAGLGAIANHLPSFTTCIEIDPERFERGRLSSPHSIYWHLFDFLDREKCNSRFDTIITNPPFSQLLPYIRRGLEVVNEGGQLVYLMPLSWMGAQGRAAEWQAMDAHISRVLVIPGRVDYLTDGVPMSQQVRAKDGKKMGGRRETDAVFIIKPGAGPKFHDYI
jgi:Predicted RNA methylase